MAMRAPLTTQGEPAAFVAIVLSGELQVEAYPNPDPDPNPDPTPNPNPNQVTADETMLKGTASGSIP